MKKEVFLKAVEVYQSMVYRMALHYFGNSYDAEDATQEVFLRLYRQEKAFESEQHLRHWLMRVTVNHCKDVLKSPWRKRRVVMALSKKYRTVLNLYYYEELSTKEIAEILDLQQTAVTTRLSRARNLLKNRLGEAWNDEE